MKRSVRMFVVCMLALQMSLMAATVVRAEDWTDPAVGSGSGGVGAWIAAAFKFYVQHYKGIDLLWFNHDGAAH